MVSLLEDYVTVLKEVEISPESHIRDSAAQNYHMPSDIVSSDEWAEFDNVYQIHCPSIFMDSALRDVCLPCSQPNAIFLQGMPTDHDAVLLLLTRQTRFRISYVEPVCHSLHHLFLTVIITESALEP